MVCVILIGHYEIYDILYTQREIKYKLPTAAKLDQKLY